jgi:hypothetical protein
LYDYDLVWLAPALAWFTDYALRRGWRHGERELLIANWLLPGLVLPLYLAVHVQLAALVLLAFFVMIVRRALGDAQPSGTRHIAECESGCAAAEARGAQIQSRAANVGV